MGTLVGIRAFPEAQINEAQFRNLLENFHNKGSTWLLFHVFRKLSFSVAGMHVL